MNFQLEKERMMLLEQLEDAVRKGAPEGILSSIIDRIREAYRKVTGWGELQHTPMSTSSTVSQVIKSGFFGPSLIPLVVTGEEPCVAAFADRVTQSVVSLTEQQKDRIAALVKAHQEARAKYPAALDRIVSPALQDFGGEIVSGQRAQQPAHTERWCDAHAE